MSCDEVLVRTLGLLDYQETWRSMRQFTNTRDAETPDEIWLLEHAPVFTQGQAGKPKHLIRPGDIPVIKSDRGGQVTYHGPGQLVMYCLIDLKRLGLGIRELVSLLENVVIELLDAAAINSSARKDAPGVYVNNAKIASLGLRVSRGRTYHGLSLNIDMDLEPFSRINPCGLTDISVTQLADLMENTDLSAVGRQIAATACRKIGYSFVHQSTEASDIS